MTLPDPDAADELDPETVRDLRPEIAAGRLRLIDCREREEWDLARLPRAELVPLSDFIDASAPLINDGTPCVVYCHHGLRSLRATQWLRERGLTAAWSMRGGIDAWSLRIDPEIPRY